jgi:hypothetical protein
VLLWLFASFSDAKLELLQPFEHLIPIQLSMAPLAIRLSLSLREKVLISVITTIVVLVIISAWIVNGRFTRQLERQSTQTLKTAEVVFTNYLNFRSQQLIARFRNITAEPRFKAVAQLGDLDTSKVLLDELLNEYDMDWALFASSVGQQLTCVAIHSKFPSEQLESRAALSIEKAFANQSNTDTVILSNALFELVSVPVLIGRQIIGAVTFAEEIDNSVAQDFKKLVNCEIVFLAKDKITATSKIDLANSTKFIDEYCKRPNEALETAADGRPIIRTFNSKSEYFYAKSGHLDTLNSNQDLRYILLFSYTDALANLKETQRLLLLLSLIGLTTGRQG